MSFNETKEDLLKDLEINELVTFDSLDQMAVGETKYLRDLRINVKNILASESFQPKEAYLLALAIAVNEKNKILSDVFSKKAKDSGASDAELAETYACASLLATNNVFYRFRHFIKSNNGKYQTMPAGIKMNIMLSPVLGKELFELMSLAVSAANGCESCVCSHEESVRKLGSSESRIFDTVKLTAIIKGLSTVVN